MILTFIPSRILAASLLVFFSLPLLAGAQELQQFSAGDIVFEYTNSENKDGVTSYYVEDVRILTEHDLDGDGDLDLWILYLRDEPVLEAHDTNDDNTPNEYFKLGSSDSPEEAYGEKLADGNEPNTIVFNERSVFGGNFSTQAIIIFIIIAIALCAFWYRRRQR